MDGESFVETVTSKNQTYLDRLGSQRLLLAITDGSVELEAVLRAAATSEAAAAETFERWAESESNELAREAFAVVANQERNHLSRVGAELDETIEFDNSGPLHSYLRQRDETIERVASGMIARSLVSVRAHTQVINFFINEADERRANIFRELKRETQETLDQGTALLDSLEPTDAQWEMASDVATYVIQLAYDDYADALSDLGVDPKPIC